MKNIFILILFILVGQTAIAQSWGRNFIRVRTPQTKISSVSTLDTKSAYKDSVSTELQYVDGLGRPLQTIGKEASPDGNDIISIVKYDEFGREVKKYLPFVAATTDGTCITNDEYAQLAFYTNASNGTYKLAQDSKPFETINYESSPLNRVLQQFKPGASWYPGHPESFSYLLNSASEVPLWTINGTTVTTSGYYALGTLTKTQITDENGNNSWEYKDLQGKVILKKIEGENSTYLSTYYVYDVFDRLTYVIPPKATGSSYTEGSNDFNELLYGYHYDGKGRMVEKHIPGGDWVYLVYNNINQLILTQDANQRGSNSWLYTKYDALGRVVLTGTMVINDNRTNIQSIVNNTTAPLWETKDFSLSNQFYYSNLAYPYISDMNTVLTVNYYDNSDFLTS